MMMMMIKWAHYRHEMVEAHDQQNQYYTSQILFRSSH